MRRRLILSTALIALAAVVVLGIPLGAVVASRVRQDAAGRLEREADAAAGAVDDRLEGHRPISPRLLAAFASPKHRIAVTTRAGRTIATGAPISGPVTRVSTGSALRGSVIAEAPSSEVNGRIRRVWLLIAALGAGGVLTAVALAALQARRLARPLETIARRSAQLGDGDFSVRAGHFGVPEIDAIAQGLDSSAERIGVLVAREREFSGNVSHQLRTPLTALRLRLEEARSAGEPQTLDTHLNAALAAADRLESTIADLLAHARDSSAGPRVPLNLGAVTYEHALAWRPVYARAGRPLDVSAEKNVLASVSRGTVGQVLDVLLSNALRHGSGAVRLGVSSNGAAASITVDDAGPGVREEDRERVFERGASHTGGTGIGLHLARALAQADNGSLRVAPGRSSRFELQLPLQALR